MKVVNAGMIAARMVGIGLILIGLIGIGAARFRVKDWGVSPIQPSSDGSATLVYSQSHIHMDPASFLIAGALMMFFSNRISRVVLYDLEDEAEAAGADSQTGSGSG